VAERGTLTIRFVDGASRRLPCSAEAAQRLAAALAESQAGREWIVLRGLPGKGRLVARRAAVQALLWEAQPQRSSDVEPTDTDDAGGAEDLSDGDAAQGVEDAGDAEDAEERGDAEDAGESGDAGDAEDVGGRGDADLAATLRAVGKELDPRRDSS
jgi:hypothetical protein